MKAIVQERYGSSETLHLRDVDPPGTVAGEVLVRVFAASVNARDWHIMRGDPYLARLMMPSAFGRGGPRRPIRGSDFAGRVEAVGAGVKRFSPGDEVYGDLREGDGAFAEYASVPECMIEHKPAGMTFEQAAAVPLAGTTALLGLRDAGRVRAGHRVLVNGASGGVGTFAVQLAKALGAHVTGVCSTRNAELVGSIGADEVVDYTKEDFAGGKRRYDVVFDLVANRSLADCRRVLAADGTLVLAGGGVSGGGRPSVFGPMGLVMHGAVKSRFARQRLVVLSAPPSGASLATLGQHMESGTMKPIVDRTYPLHEVPEAIRYLELEHARAKVVITM
jgi:NADPH:quinone reductase-like Zn-dependent oxidoreductase